VCIIMFMVMAEEPGGLLDMMGREGPKKPSHNPWHNPFPQYPWNQHPCISTSEPWPPCHLQPSKRCHIWECVCVGCRGLCPA
jgi:hypothetical protein